MILIHLNLLRCVLWPRIWSTLIKVPHVLEKKKCVCYYRRVLCYFFLASRVSHEKFAVIKIDFVEVIYHFSLATIKIFFFAFSFSKCTYYVSWCEFVWVYSFGDFAYLFSNCVFHQIWEVFSHYFFKYFFQPYSLFPFLLRFQGVHCYLTGFWGFVCLFFFCLLFSLCCLDRVNSIDLSSSSQVHGFYFVISNLILSTSQRVFFKLCVIT